MKKTLLALGLLSILSTVAASAFAMSPLPTPLNPAISPLIFPLGPPQA